MRSTVYRHLYHPWVNIFVGVAYLVFVMGPFSIGALFNVESIVISSTIDFVVATLIHMHVISNALVHRWYEDKFSPQVYELMRGIGIAILIGSVVIIMVVLFTS